MDLYTYIYVYMYVYMYKCICIYVYLSFLRTAQDAALPKRRKPLEAPRQKASASGTGGGPQCPVLSFVWGPFRNPKGLRAFGFRVWGLEIL